MEASFIVKYLQYIVNGDPIHVTTTSMLQDLLGLIHECKYGFIGEAIYDSEYPYLRFHTIHGFPEDGPFMRAYKKNNYIDFMQYDTLHEEVFKTGQRVICNDIKAHRKGKPYPPGHPDMKNFAVFPLKSEDEIIGAIGLSGEKDFTEEYIDTFITSINVIECILILIMDNREKALYKNSFLANVSHEIRTPLNGIICTSRMMNDTELTGEQKELMSIVTHCSIQLLDIANDIMDYTKITNGLLKLNRKPMSVIKCLHDVLDVFRPKIETKGLKLDSDIKNLPKMLIGDSTRLMQILLNILSNALKFTIKGHIKLHAEVEHQEAEYCLLKFALSDTGIGMTKKKLKNIFNSFRQNDGPGDYLSNEYGMGLGLPITKHLVELHNGKLWIESALDKGTTVYFTLQFDIYNNSVDVSLLKKQYIGKYILVISDNEAERKEIFEILSSVNIRPIMVYKIEEAIMYLTNDIFSFCVIIAGDGVEITTLKTKVPIVAVNGPTEDVSEYILTHPLKDHMYSLLHALYVSVIQPHDAPSAEPDECAPGLSLKILVAEDNVSNQKVITKLLNKIGQYDITIANDGLEMYMELGKSHYDLAFVDLKMPVMDGLTATIKFKEKFPTKRVIIAAVTASMSESIKSSCYDAGMNGYITKPIDHKQLESLVNLVIRKRLTGM